MAIRLSNITIYFLIALTTFLTSSPLKGNENTHSDKLVIGTAPEDGEYFDVGHSIAKLLAKSGMKNIEVVATNGSIDNLRSLDSGKLHFGIVQSDILYDYQKERLEGLQNSGEIGSVASLFPEYIQLLVHKDSEKQYRSLLRLAGKKVFIDPKGSGSERNATAIMELYQLNPDEDFQLIGGTRENALKQLRAKEIDAILVTTGELLSDEHISLVGFDYDFSRKLLREFPYLNSKEYKNGFYTSYIPYTRSVLVTRYRNDENRTGVEAQVVKKITKLIYDGWYDIQKFTPRNVDFFPHELAARKVPVDFHEAASEFYTEIDIISEFRTEYFVLLLVLSTIVAVSIIRNMPVTFNWVHNFFQSSRFHWFRDNQTWCKTMRILEKITCYHSWTIMLWGFALILVFDVAIILHFEEVFAHENDVTNPFHNKTVMEIIFWLLTFAVTGFNQNIFPNSDVARVSAIIIPIAAVIEALFIVINETMKKGRLQDRLLKGEILPTFKDAVVICGWNDRVPSLVNNLLSPYAPKKRFKKIVIIAETKHERPIEKFGLDPSRVSFYRGISSSYEILTKGEIELSHSSVVVADENKVKKGNQRSLLTVSAIREITSRKNARDYRIIAEAFYPQNLPAFDAYSVKRLVCLRSYSTRLLTHALLNPGVSELLLNMLSYNPPYQLSEIPSEQHEYLNRSYFDVAKQLRTRHKKLLLCTYQHSESLKHNPLELDFREDTPYCAAPQHNKGTEADMLITNQHSLVYLELVSGKNHDSSLQIIEESFEAVDVYTEKFLIIGNSDVALNIYDKLKGIGASVRYIVIDEHQNTAMNQPKRKAIEDGNIDYTQDLYEDLKAQNITIKADERILVVAPSRDPDSILPSIYQDDDSLKIISSVNSWFKSEQGIEPPHIAAEVRELKNKELFFNAGVKQIIPTNKLIELLLTRMVYHNGRISGFILKSMSYHNNNNLCRIEKWSISRLQDSLVTNVLGQTYDEVLEICLLKGLQLLAIETIDEHKNKKIILNPEAEIERTRGLTIEDKVYVFVKVKPLNAARRKDS